MWKWFICQKNVKKSINVTAFDFSENNIQLAQQYDCRNIDYKILDATKENDLKKLCNMKYQGIVANMVLMDMPNIEVLFSFMNQLLTDNGVFVFSIQHPCFNSEYVDINEDKNTLSIRDYININQSKGIAIPNQVAEQYYFHRPISYYINLGVQYNLVVNGFVEPIFNRNIETGAFSKIPPVLIIRMKKQLITLKQIKTQIMNRLDRLTSILLQLQSKRLTTAREIAERFEVTTRTIYRDIRTLRLAGVPIGEEEGKGYFLVEGYRLPPVMFTMEEARALVTTSKILNYHSEDSLKQNYESALFKIKAVLPLKDKDKLEFLDSRIGFHKPWAPMSLYLDNIQHSITECRKVKIKYQSKREERITERIIHPYAVYFSGAVWTTIGFCELRQEIREFRLDRIKEIILLYIPFKPDDKFSIEHYLEKRSKRKF